MVLGLESEEVLHTQDCPDGQYHMLEKSGKKLRSKPWRELYNGITNYRMWGLAVCYAYTFGVEVSCLDALLFVLNFGDPCLSPQLWCAVLVADGLGSVRRLSAAD